jgi:hypothetical protein
MHKEKVSGMSHEYIFWMIIFENTSNANLLDVFYR